jgi:lysozyme family protein
MGVEFECRLDRRQAAAFLTARGYRTAPATLAKLACIGGGPTFESFGRKPLYREAELLAWAKARTTGPRRSTSDPGAGPSGGEGLSNSRT